MFGFLRRKRSGRGGQKGRVGSQLPSAAQPDMGNDVSREDSGRPAGDQPSQGTPRELFFGVTVLSRQVPSEDLTKSVGRPGNVSTEEEVSRSRVDTHTNSFSVKNESECSKCGDEKCAANETEEEVSVTADVGDYALDLAKPGAVASREGFSPGNIPEVGPTTVTGEFCGAMEVSREGPEEARGALYRCEDTESSEEESEEESGEESGEESEEDSGEEDVVKNDSGCWEERGGRTGEPIPFGLPTGGILCRSGRLSLEKKRVKWADLDGKSDLSRADTDDWSGEEEGSSSEEEEPPAAAQDSGSEEEDSEEEEEEEDSEEEDDSEEDDRATCRVQSNISEVNGPNTAEDSEAEDSSEEEDAPQEKPVEDKDPSPISIDVAEMQKRIADLQKDIDNKTSNIDRLQEELDSACNESEKVRQRFRRLEEDLELYRQTNKELTEKLQITEKIEEEKILRSNWKFYEAEKRIGLLETELENLKADYNNLQISYKKLQADRDMEVQIIQKALEKALTDQEEMEAKYEKEFENLRTLNSGREVQMLEDFEWKLREVQRNCKKKIQDYETEYEQKNIILASQLASAQADLEQISHLKLCEIELNQLKQTSSEQRKNLRLANRKLEELQVSEKILQEEVNSLRSSLDKEKTHIVALQTMHKEELAEKDRKMKIKMEIQIKQLTQEWEERLRKECYKIKTELERTSREERAAALDLANKMKEKEISQLNQNMEKKSQEFKKEIERYKNKIIELENHHRNDLDNAQTNADRELFDLRRKMDKLDMSYQERIEQLQEKHENEIMAVKEECDKRVQQSEAAFQMQIGNSRTTLELVKQQLLNDAQLKLEKLENIYQQKLEQQRIAFQKEKENALSLQEENHKNAVEMLYKDNERLKKQARSEHENLVKRRNQQLCNQMQQKNKVQENDKGHSQNLISTRLDVAEVAEEIRAQGKEEVLQRSIEQLTKQLNAGKMEIEKLRQQLEARENRQQQQQSQGGQPQRNNAQPVPNPRRNRKGRSGRN